MASDEELLDAWAKGDTRSGQRLFCIHFDAVRRFFGNKVTSESAVEDLVQRTFTRCIEVLPRRRGSSTFRTFLFGVAHNVLREYYRAELRAKRESELHDVRAVELGEGPITLIVRENDQRRLLKALRRLPLDMQVLLELYYFERLSSRELGEILEANENTIRSRLRKARELLLGEYQALLGAGSTLETTVADLETWAADIRAYLESHGTTNG